MQGSMSDINLSRHISYTCKRCTKLTALQIDVSMQIVQELDACFMKMAIVKPMHTDANERTGRHKMTE